jgi:hypothetical protein
MVAPDLATAFGVSNLLKRGNGTAIRTAMEMSCLLWRAQNLPSLKMMVNPHSVTFNQPKRITKKNTQGGTVYTHWTDLNGQNNDILELQFKGRSGNIRQQPDPAKTGILQSVANGLQLGANALTGTTGDMNTPTPNQGLAKHIAWSQLYQLTRLPVVDPATRLRNVFDITYISPILPRPVVFLGFYNNVLNFTEDADRPWLIEYSYSFIVQSTQPSLDTLTQMLTQLLNSSATGLAASEITTSQAQQSSTTGAVTGANFKQG